MKRIIIWAETREQFSEGRELAHQLGSHGSKTIGSNIALFSLTPGQFEAADGVVVYQGHPNAKACAAAYRQIGAQVALFGPEPDEEAAPKPSKGKAKKAKPEEEAAPREADEK